MQYHCSTRYLCFCCHTYHTSQNSTCNSYLPIYFILPKAFREFQKLLFSFQLFSNFSKTLPESKNDCYLALLISHSCFTLSFSGVFEPNLVSLIQNPFGHMFQNSNLRSSSQISFRTQHHNNLIKYLCIPINNGYTYVRYTFFVQSKHS